MAIFRTFIHISLILIIAMYASYMVGIKRQVFVIATLIITPFFQTYGFERFMGITDRSIAYTFCYALPNALILIYFFPFFKSYTQQSVPKFSFITHLLLITLSIIIAFGGALDAPIILLVCPSTLLYLAFVGYKKNVAPGFYQRTITAIDGIPKALLFHFIFISGISLYSFYVGTFNEENSWATLPLLDRYWLLVKGIGVLLLKNKGVPVLAMGCLINVLLVRRIKNKMSERLIALILSLAVFSTIYLSLLPLGGYRTYRPYIVRYDTFSPVTICLIFTYTLTAIYITNHYKGIVRSLFILFVLSIMMHFTIADKIEWDLNKCDRNAFALLANSSDKIVFIDDWCNVLSWNKITDPNATELNCRLLKYWGVLKEDKLYFQKEN